MQYPKAPTYPHHGKHDGILRGVEFFEGGRVGGFGPFEGGGLVGARYFGGSGLEERTL